MPQVTDLANVKAFGLRIVQGLRLSFRSRVMAGTVVLNANDPPVHYLDLNGAARNLDLPAAAGNDGLTFTVRNITGTAQTLTIRDALAATVTTLAQNTFAVVHCDGTVWRVIG